MELLKDKLFETISKYVKDYETSFGYIIPGHGMKGKQVAINTDEELVAMYNFHKKKCILLDSLYHRYKRFTGLETDHVLSLATNNRGALTAE